MESGSVERKLERHNIRHSRGANPVRLVSALLGRVCWSNDDNLNFTPSELTRLTIDQLYRLKDSLHDLIERKRTELQEEGESFDTRCNLFRFCLFMRIDSVFLHIPQNRQYNPLAGYSQGDFACVYMFVCSWMGWGGGGGGYNCTGSKARIRTASTDPQCYIYIVSNLSSPQQASNLTVFIRISALGSYLVFRILRLGAYSRWWLFETGRLFNFHHLQPHISLQ